ncbi:MAG: winged helix-turn-helix domain-containing protein [Candidatus Bathyarchaeota archaeon]|jgi:predicted transcriptional regulator|nr:winged helix-turn-helix domain-containing protein [Candidatus Bathyarchaeota archaeon]
MKRRRSKLEVYLDVLWTIKNGTTKPTRIMYESNLSWKPLQRTLNSLAFQGLVTEYEPEDNRDRRTTTCYELTQKGENVLKYFKRAEDLLELEISPRLRL